MAKNEGPKAAPEGKDDDAFAVALEELRQVYDAVRNWQEAPGDDAGDDDTARICAAELAQANEIFAKYLTEHAARGLLPAEARELLADEAAWRNCYAHIRCCVIFGWLVCRRFRTFRSFAYYLYHYWICVRRAFGNPVHNPLTADEHRDFETLVTALAGAYRPYLADQLASVDFPAGIPDELVAGRIDCFEGEEAAAAIFERLLTPEVAPALLGATAFEPNVRQQWFWFCRCWCLCAIRFGCCLAHAHSFAQWKKCLALYQACLRRCFGPLECALNDLGCASEEPFPAIGANGIEITGTASGGSFSHYVLEWSTNGVVYHATDFHYPPVPAGGTAQGNSPVFGGVLAVFDTTFKAPGLYFVRITVLSTTGATKVCEAKFELLKKDVRILGVDGHSTMDTGWTDPNARFVETIAAECELSPGVFERPGGTYEVSFGDCLSIQGGAFVGGCESTKVKQYTIDIKPGSETDCNTGGWTTIWGPIEYVTPAQNSFTNWRTDFSTLTSYWGPDCIIPSFASGCAPFRQPEPNALLYPSCWNSHTGPCVLSGLYTLRLTVEDSNGVTYCDLQRIWIDNKRPCAMIRIDAVPKCADLFISQFATPADCGTPWKLPVSGIAYDEYIDPMAPLARPNDNFDYYQVKVTKQGGAAIWLPIQSGPSGDCFKGFKRVGDPGVACHCDPAHPDPGALFGTLATFDLRAIDPDCSGKLSYVVPPDFTTPRGECCVYTFEVWAYDRTIRNTGLNWAHDMWPVKICNDLKKG